MLRSRQAASSRWCTGMVGRASGTSSGAPIRTKSFCMSTTTRAGWASRSIVIRDLPTALVSRTSAVRNSPVDAWRPTPGVPAAGPPLLESASGLLGLDEEFRAAVLGPAVFAVNGAERAVLSVARGREPTGIDAQPGERDLDRVRAPLAQRQVVGVGAALVTVT